MVLPIGSQARPIRTELATMPQIGGWNVPVAYIQAPPAARPARAQQAA
jgi:hypothetical protein